MWNNTVTLKSGLEVTQGHGKWYDSKKSAAYVHGLNVVLQFSFLSGEG